MKRGVLLMFISLFLFTSCTLIQKTEEAAAYPDETSGLAPTFAVVTWNVAKGRKSSQSEVTGFIKNLGTRLPSPVIALQEATGEMLAIPGFGAHFAKSFHWWWSDTPSGVALLAPTAPLATHTIAARKREFRCTTPKMGLAAIYPITDSDNAPHQLLVVTLHGLNFELSTQGLSAQMASIHELISGFDGPVVVCGDFNTWSARRLAVVTKALPGFAEAPVRGERYKALPMVTLMGGDTELAVDRIFYRGLELTGPATAFPVALSDHVPIMAQFTLP